jgi:hypothetical protein
MHSPQFQQSAGATLLNSLSGGQEGLILTVMDGPFACLAGPYRLPWKELLSCEQMAFF